MKSVWHEGIDRVSFDKLQGYIKTDVLIIGGGMAGVLCAYMLQGEGVDCVVCEANTIFSGVTQNTTAKITCQHGAIYDKMIKRFGADVASLYYKSQSEALREYRKLSEKIDCEFNAENSYVYSCDDRKKIEDEVTALNKIGCDAVFEEKLSLPFDVAGAVCMKNQAQFNPLKFGFGLAKRLKIFENTKITELTPNGCKTEKGKIKADKIIVATHFPFINKHGAYFFKMYQHRSYVIALHNAQNVDGMYVDEADTGLSFRNYKDLLLLGGGGHRTGKHGGNWQELRSFADEYYPEAKEVCHWATQDCKTLDDIPYIGRYSKNTPNLYVATGYNKWGMTSSMVSAMLLADLVQNKENEYSAVYSPSRMILRPQLAVNVFESILGLLTPTVPRCPHLGCSLKYNPYEHTWDCSCHGSRFAENGKLLDNPATDDKQL